ncbi:MAG: RNA polymerase sigma factor [Solirubrobacteraceae bacterium]
MSSRRDQIAEFYALKAAEHQRAIRRAITGPEALIEDACSYAWTQLLTHPEVALDDSGFRWLYVVAWNEGVKLSTRARRETPTGADELPQRMLISEDAAVAAERHDEAHTRLAQLADLPARQATMVFLHASGLTYSEIARVCGVTLRTVERQLLRGKRTLRRRDRERVG